MFILKRKLRNGINVVYNTALPVIFGVKKYADCLWGVCKQRDITVNLQTNLVKIDPSKRQATFEKLNSPGEIVVQEVSSDCEIKNWANIITGKLLIFSLYQYSLLHVTPPMGPPIVLKEHPALTTEAGFLSVDPKTLRHTKYSNIFGIGDCTNTPNSKTMAAIGKKRVRKFIL